MDCDVVVVGGSYSGLAAAMQLARARRRVVVIDAGRRRNRAAVAAHGFITRDGEDPGVIRSMALQELQRYPDFAMVPGEAVSARRATHAFQMLLAGGGRMSCRKIILATGVVDELPPMTGLADHWGRSVVPCPYCHAYESATRPLGVVNMRAVSVHQATLMPDWGPTTFFVQNGPEPDGKAFARLTARGVAIERSPIVEFIGSGSRLKAVRLADGRTVPLALAFLTPVTALPGQLAEGLDCALDDGSTGPLIRVDGRQETTTPGVFAAGDICLSAPSISIAVSTGVIAGVAAHHSLVHDLASPAESGEGDRDGALEEVVDKAAVRAS